MDEINTISGDLAEIENIIRIYLDLLYKGDVDLIKSVFHQEATVSSISEGQIISVNMEGFRKRVATRESPESIGETRHDKIILIDIF